MNIFVSLYNFIFKNIKRLFNTNPLIINNHIPINWNLLSINPNAVILFDQPINWEYIFNPLPYYNYAEIKEKNKVINNHIIEEFAKRTYKPEKIINLNSPDLEKEMEEYISVYE
jgi:hypothetical protein